MVARDKNGRFLKGTVPNPKGRRKGPTNKHMLWDAINRIESQEDRIPLLDQYVLQAYEDNSILAHLMNKLIPTLKAVENKVTGDVRVEGGITPALRRMIDKVKSYDPKA